MDQDFYDFIRQNPRRRFEANLNQMELNKASRENPPLRKRSLLYLSDVLLAIGQRVRPAEFRVHVHVGQAHDGTFEVNAEGC
jgi:hypothetical protein